jgi:hypothetical protein
MHIEIRLFPGMAGQGGRLSARRGELQALFRELSDLRGFELAETREGVALVAVAERPEAAREGQRRFVAWVQEHLPDLAGHDAFAVTGAVIARAEG